MKVGFLGLGAMGSRMAVRLLGEHEVTVYNRTRARAEALLEAGAAWAETPREAAEGADVVIAIVTDDEAAAEVWFDPERGALAGLAPGAIAIESSTVTPEHVARLAREVDARGAHLLDAPVAGSRPQAEAGALIWLVGGEAEVVDRARPLLDLMGKAVLHAGDVGQGSILKLVVNALFAGQVALIAELLRAAESAGADAARVQELLAGMPVTSPAAALASKMMLAGDHAPRFPIDLVAKDLRYASGMGEAPLVEAALARYEAASAQGLGGQHITAVHLADT